MKGYGVIMKKIFAVLLALVLTFSCATVAFADESSTGTKGSTNLVCGYCNSTFATEEALEEHLKQFHSGLGGDLAVDNENLKFLSGLTATDLLDKLIEVLDIHAAQWDGIDDIIIRLIDMIENLISGTFSKYKEEDVAGAVTELETKVCDLGLAGEILEYCENLINTLKQKIKDLYSGNKETTVVEEPAETGSSAIGIAAFVAVSTAAAVAFVCTRKKEEK
jgi:hypothetical protein